MKEFMDIVNWIPYSLFVFLPIMIAISPSPQMMVIAATAASGAAASDSSAHNSAIVGHMDFSAARLAQFEYGGQLFGSKAAALSMDARPPSAGHLLRKVVVAKMKDITLSTVNDMITAGVGGIIFSVPKFEEILTLTQSQKENIQQLEEHFASTEFEIPIYFVEDSPEILDLVEKLEDDGTANNSGGQSAAQALLEGIVSNGFQLVSSAAHPKQLTEQNLVSVQATMQGRSGEDNLPTVLLVSHYDAGGAAPSLSFGYDSNGSGVAILLELARLFGQLYKSPKTQPDFNLIFLATAGGKVNYFGSKKWLEDQRDSDDQKTSDNIKLVICLDSLGSGSDLNVHVSKPPKEGQFAHKFLSDLKTLSSKLKNKVAVEMIHKKINLANEQLAWEHERYSIGKLSALTLSHLKTPFTQQRSSILDRQVDVEGAMTRNTKLIAEALACSIYSSKKVPSSDCEGNFFTGSRSASSADFLSGFMDALTAQPRSQSLLAGGHFPPARRNNQATSQKQRIVGVHPLVSYLHDTLSNHTYDVTYLVAKRDKREPEFAYFDGQTATISVYRVKPAVFDLVLSLAIAAYIGLWYLGLNNFDKAAKIMATLGVSQNSAQNNSNGINGHSNSNSGSPKKSRGYTNGNGVNGNHLKMH